MTRTISCKRIFRIVLLTPIILIFGGILAGIANNHLGPETVDEQQVRQAFDQSVDWLVVNQARVLGEGRKNPMLWWFVKKALMLSRDERLERVFISYLEAESRNINQIWLAMLRDRPLQSFRVSDLTSAANFGEIPAYNFLFAYGVSCDENLRDSNLVRHQLEVNYCLRSRLLSPACITHQMLGLKIMQDNFCGEQRKTVEKLGTLGEVVFWQLAADFRMTDIYVQRLMVLYENEQQEKIRQRWLRRFLDAQLKDGSWPSDWEIVPLPGNRYLTIDKTGFHVRQRTGSFHTTAQGILLTAHMISSQNTAARR